jgi:hypothetical protein
MPELPGVSVGGIGMRMFIRIISTAFMLIGICSFWHFTEECFYGFSQSSIVDSIVAIAITFWLDHKIWEE